MYEKQTWVTGDVVTADRLNHMEDGIASAQVYTDSETVRFSGSVTTAERDGTYTAQFDCNLSDTPEQIKVTFDDTEYTVSKIKNGVITAYGGVSKTGPDFSEYPFTIMVQPTQASFYTETASTHQVVIKAVERTINSELQPLLPLGAVVNKTTLAELEEAWDSGRLVYCLHNSEIYFLLDGGNPTINCYPDYDSFVISTAGVLTVSVS